MSGDRVAKAARVRGLLQRVVFDADSLRSNAGMAIKAGISTGVLSRETGEELLSEYTRLRVQIDALTKRAGDAIR